MSAVTIHQEPLNWTYVCDVCGMTKAGDGADIPPPGFATIWVRHDKGVGVAAHLCAGTCLAIGAENLSQGRAANGMVV